MPPESSPTSPQQELVTESPEILHVQDLPRSSPCLRVVPHEHTVAVPGLHYAMKPSMWSSILAHVAERPTPPRLIAATIRATTLMCVTCGAIVTIKIVPQQHERSVCRIVDLGMASLHDCERWRGELFHPSLTWFCVKTDRLHLGKMLDAHPCPHVLFPQVPDPLHFAWLRPREGIPTILHMQDLWSSLPNTNNTVPGACKISAPMTHSHPARSRCDRRTDTLAPIMPATYRSFAAPSQTACVQAAAFEVFAPKLSRMNRRAPTWNSHITSKWQADLISAQHLRTRQITGIYRAVFLSACYLPHICRAGRLYHAPSVNGLCLWHIYNDAPWHGDGSGLSSLKKAGDRAGVAFKRPPHGPVTKAHIHAIRASLDLNSGFGAAAWSSAIACFWGCRRLGELVIKSAATFSWEHDTCRDTRISFSEIEEHEVIDFHVVWTKTTTIFSAECILMQIKGEDADLCPTWAFNNHLVINDCPPPLTPLFAFREHGTWRPLTKDHFLRTIAAIFLAAGLASIFGHSFRIRGLVEFLLVGVAPEIIMKLGGWTSLCFLIYCRCLEQILPRNIIAAWTARIKAFASSHGHPYDSSALNFDGED
ncbi:hypothetical protein DFH07DRAFT_973470 [Mycena maculata]|uniref:DNA breaking-rejoining enzyme n=1 Tax=Mycena maculata TaxID=230809 RepID=A0AAD7HDQ3_9AGAR|nr:hypothetical protein DFH07DRAFT_973470 [Mycena maculata]